MKPRLITIPFSHFCEKARWALDCTGVAYEEEGHLPVFHYIATLVADASRTVPVIVDGASIIGDSTKIVAWADALNPGALIPTSDAARRDALALEDDFDRALGPASRRWAYFHILPRKDLDHLIVKGVPRWQAAALRLFRPLAVAFMRRSMNITREGAERSRRKIDETFGRVAELLADGRPFLVGERFTVADLTFAALAAPIVLPPQYPAEMPALIEHTPAARTQLEAWRDSRAGRFALRMYETERGGQRLGVDV